MDAIAHFYTELVRSSLAGVKGHAFFEGRLGFKEDDLPWVSGDVSSPRLPTEDEQEHLGEEYADEDPVKRAFVQFTPRLHLRKLVFTCR